MFLSPRKGIKDEHLQTGCGKGSDLLSVTACGEKVQVSLFTALLNSKNPHSCPIRLCCCLSLGPLLGGEQHWNISVGGSPASQLGTPFLETPNGLPFSCLYLLAWELFLLYLRRLSHPVIAYSKQTGIYSTPYFSHTILKIGTILAIGMYWLCIMKDFLKTLSLHYIMCSDHIHPLIFSSALFFSPAILFHQDSPAFNSMQSISLQLYLYHLHPSLPGDDCI